MPTTISIQFHALPDELLLFVSEIVVDLGLRVVAMSFFPFAAYEVTLDQLGNVFSSESSVCQLGFTLETPRLPATSNRNFGENNPTRLRLDIEPPRPGYGNVGSLVVRSDSMPR